MAAADWLTAEVARGLQRLLVLSLPGRPQAEVIRGTATAWADALQVGRAWDQDRDAPRIREGFVRLSSTAAQWPTPRDLLGALPPAPQQKRLAPPTTIPATPAARAARLRALLGDACTVPPPESNDPQNAPQGVLAASDEMPPLTIPPGPDEE